jgi:hypothetical protein
MTQIRSSVKPPALSGGSKLIDDLTTLDRGKRSKGG